MGKTTLRTTTHSELVSVNLIYKPKLCMNKWMGLQ
jgi:hypothetical protein